MVRKKGKKGLSGNVVKKESSLYFKSLCIFWTSIKQIQLAFFFTNHKFLTDVLMYVCWLIAT